MKYTNRHHAGKVLAKLLGDYAEQKNVIILGLARGGIPVAYEIAQQLKVPLDALIIRKLGVPQHKELAMGAIASGGAPILNESIVNLFDISSSALNSVIHEEQAELERREERYRGNKPYPPLAGKTVILVDDGIATGATMKAAIAAVIAQKANAIIVAVPVASIASCYELKKSVTHLICPEQPLDFDAVGLWYHDFSQTSDEEVIDLLARS